MLPLLVLKLTLKNRLSRSVPANVIQVPVVDKLRLLNVEFDVVVRFKSGVAVPSKVTLVIMCPLPFTPMRWMPPCARTVAFSRVMLIPATRTAPIDVALKVAL